MSNKAEILKMKIVINRERFFTFQHFGIEQRNGETKNENYNKPRKIFFFSNISELSNGTEKPKKKNYNKQRKIFDFSQSLRN